MFSDYDYPIDVPTWKKGDWSITSFDKLENFKDFLFKLFKEPGEYGFDKHIKIFNECALEYNKKGYYCSAPFKSRDFRNYWDDQKHKCRVGIIIHGDDKTWYIPREYYMWLNFLPIYDKEKKDYLFPRIWDAQYHMAIYEILAELNNLHSAILKKRQIASSYFHCAKLLNQYWFEKGAKVKMGASLKDFINDKGSWKMVQEYSDFLNAETAWYRPHNPGKVMDWEQKIGTTVNGKETHTGLKSTFTGHTFEKSATQGVGGPCRYFFHEEAGVASKMGDTYEYMRPALSSGAITTGMFIAAGSVGDLEQCEPLKDLIMNPDDNDIYAVESNLINDKGEWGRHGLFIPEQWSMPPCIDEFGNSQVEEALEIIKEQRIIWKKKLKPDKYQLRISQKPINIAEAFAYRKASIFPLHRITEQQRRIDEKEYPYEFLDIFVGKDGKADVKTTKKIPILEFPVTKSTEDKTGTLVVWERPKENSNWGTYYAGIDPVSEGKTTTSDSLCSIYVYKNPVEVTRENENGELETFVEPDKIVAAWCGRFDDINKTHERLELIIEWYNAWTIVENNIPQFITHMVKVKKQKYLIPKDQIIFLKDLSANKSVYSEYGWKNTGTMFKSHLISYAIEFVREQIDEELNEDGSVLSVKFGVERIPDPMLLKEMAAYHDGLNVDRLVAFSSLIAFAKMQQANRGYIKRRDEESYENLEKSKNLYKLNKRPFAHMGGQASKRKAGKRNRNPFRNIR
jgi:hypothetical protein